MRVPKSIMNVNAESTLPKYCTSTPKAGKWFTICTTVSCSIRHEVSSDTRTKPKALGTSPQLVFQRTIAQPALPSRLTSFLDDTSRIWRRISLEVQETDPADL